MIDDRELSELVSTRVMGWSLRENGNREVGGTLYCDPLGCICTGFPSYATDAGLALGAAMKARGPRGIEIIPQSGGKFLIPFEDIGEPNVYTYGLTLSRALSFAALRAEGVEVQDDSDKAAERQGE